MPEVVRNGVDFSFHMIPNFETLRSLLRIHPDGGNVVGTQGCIGLQAGADQLIDFREVVRNALGHQPALNLTINITGNPNNDGSGGTVESNGE